MKIAVIGSGTMGLGIAQVCAQAGYSVVLYDIREDALHKAKSSIEGNLHKAVDLGKLEAHVVPEICSRLNYSIDERDLVADLIIEAIIEKLEVKTALFQRLSAQNSIDSIFATNTSSIPITRISAEVPNPERVVGIHFFNPAHIMKLVEVVQGAHTSDKVVEQSIEFVKRLDKVPIRAKDAPGFIVNRVARHFYVEGLKVLEEQLASHETVDELMESIGFKMGPFRLMDLIGVDTNFSVTESMYQLFYQDAKFRPNRIQKQKVDAGFHGRKSGKGFYEYT